MLTRMCCCCCWLWMRCLPPELKSLRERFEEDRQMVEKLKRANKFKPE